MLLTNRKTFKNNEYIIILYEYYGCLYVAHLYPNNGENIAISAMFTTSTEAINSVMSTTYSIKDAA